MRGGSFKISILLPNFVIRILDKFLEKLGNYLQLNIKYYIKNAFYLTFANMVSAIFGLLLSVSFARFLPKEVYGQYSYVMSIFGVLAFFTLPGVNTAIIQAVARGYGRVFVEGIKIRFRWSILGSIVMLAIGVYYFLDNSEEIGKCLIASSLFFPAYYVTDTVYAYLVGRKEFDKVARYQVLVQVVSVSLTIFIIYFSKDLLVIILTYMLISSVIKLNFLLKFKDVESKKFDKSSISFGRHLTLMNIFSNLQTYFDRLVIGIFLGFADLASYTIALGFSEQVKSLSSVVSTLIFPRLSEMDETTAIFELKRRLPKYMFIFGIISGVLITLSPHIILFLFSEKYNDSVLYSQLLLFSIFVAQPALILNKAYFPSQRKIMELYVIRVSQPIVEILSICIFVYIFGVFGVVISKLLSRIYITILSIYFFYIK